MARELSPETQARIEAGRAKFLSKPAKKMHPADIATREAIGRATAFSVFMHRFKARIVERGFSSLASAAERADQLEAAHPGKAALIYAEVEGISHPVPRDLRAAASAHQPKETTMTIDASYSTKFAAERARKAISVPEAFKVTGPNADGRYAVEQIEGTEVAALATDAKPTKKTQAAVKKAKAPKAEKAAKTPAQAKVQKSEKAVGKRAAIQAAAEKGKLPAAPDFSAETHARFRPKLEELVKLVKAKDIKALKKYEINAVSSSPKALDRFRNLAVIALEAQARA